MIDWGMLSIDTIFRGSSPDGSRYLPIFLLDYTRVVKPKESPSASCKRCVAGYLQTFLNHNKMSTSKYKLRPRYEGVTIFGTGKVITNANLTDADAKKLLKSHPAGEKLFDVIPKAEPKAVTKPKKQTVKK